MLLRKLFYALPAPWRFAARRAAYAPLDFYQWITGKKEELVPPKGLIYTGSGDFKRQGEQLVRQFVEYAGLKPQHRVLDVGSGIGRVAVGLTAYLDAQGSYEGFDVVKTGVDWCRKKITSRFPQFRFQYIPLKNDLYTSQGVDAAAFSFPYPDATFDFACVISVFTHMVPGEVERYCNELHRCLQPGGRVFATFFILKNDTDALSNPAFTFPHRYEHHALMDAQVQSGNVAFDEDFLRTVLFPADRFDIEKMLPGFWRGTPKEASPDFQDIVVVRKRG